MPEVVNYEIMKGHCPIHGLNSFADVICHHHVSLEDNEIGVWWKIDYRILKCRACNYVYFRKDEISSEDIEGNYNLQEWEPYPYKVSYWPSPIRRKAPDWIIQIDSFDSNLGLLVGELYGTINNDLYVAAAIVVRTIFDGVSVHLGINPALSFVDKLQELETGGKISKDEKVALDALINAGSAAAHRGWRPKPQELDVMVSILETFLHRTFVLGQAARQLKESVPPRQKRDRSARREER